MGPEIRVRLEKAVEAHIVYHRWQTVGGRAPRSIVQNMCFCEGKTKAQEVRAQEECECLESWIFVCRGEERNPVDNGLDGVGWEGHGQKLQPHIHKQYYTSSMMPSSSQVANT